MPEDTQEVKKPGTITKVSYGHTVNIQGYEAVRFDLTAEVGPHEKWQDVFERLRTLADKLKIKVYKDYARED